jgi:hypothetical protein
MKMTPKKILSLPVYGSGTTFGLIAAILLLPGGLIMAIALGLYWLADKLSADDPDYPTCDMTVEEYESTIMSGDAYGEDTIPVPLIEFESHPEAGFKFTLQKCNNCVYNDACLPVKGDWCDGWEEDEYAD